MFALNRSSSPEVTRSTNDDEGKSKASRVVLGLLLVSLVAAIVLVSTKYAAHPTDGFVVSRSVSLEWDDVPDSLAGVQVEGDSLFTHAATLSSSKRMRFGQSVAVDGDVAVIGAPKAIPVRDGSGNRMYKGMVIVLRRSGYGKKWRRTQILWVKSGWEFGYKVALERKGTVLAVSSIQRNAVHIFTMNKRGKFVPLQKVVPKKTNRLPWTGYGSSFGTSVTLCGPYLVVGARHETVNALYYYGGVFIYKWNGQKYVRMQRYLSGFGPGHFDVATSMSKSRPNMLVVGTMANFGKVRIMKLNKAKNKFVVVRTLKRRMRVFGSSVSLHGKFLAVGAFLPQLNTAGVNNPGFVFVYKEVAKNKWKLVAKLTKGQKGLGFGSSVKMTGKGLVIGAPMASKKYGDKRGAVFVYKKKRGSLRLVQRIYSRRRAKRGFGKSVDVSGNTLIAGGYGNRGKGIVSIYN